ncbi:subunit length determinant protein [Hydrogenivirga caldilitoris]|uniref:Subunit length determinant protein n=1 Tax=Hydrogenivirga caldilitoris TaxID=246264 RepID=A0A497XNA5_9AQUI|nr:Wzz/FepE/Etk N-terminal domain-containing protein [Hydrogenivirga caldilitoris]RLJ70427.1 subunit length determinant protein [Hydrogenivirga caldilitoris]
MEKQRGEIYYEEEIDLYELWLRLKKRWKVVAGTVLLFLVASLVYLFVAKPVYESSAVIKIGYDPVFLINPEEPKFLPILTPQEFSHLISSINLDVKGLKNIEAQPETKSPSTVIINISAYDPEVIEPAFRKLMARIENNPMVKDKIYSVKSILQTRKKKLLEALQELYTYKKELNQKDIDKLAEVSTRIAMLEREFDDIRILLSNIRAFEVISEPRTPTQPSKPKKLLILAVSFVSSLFLGIFLALFLEWLEEARKRYRERSIES